MTTVFCDQDGVLADFHEGVKLQIGKCWDEFKGKKDLRDKITFGRPGFWEDLPLMPDARTLWWILAKYEPHVLTAYPYRAEDPKNPDGPFFRRNAEVGKYAWFVQHEFGLPEERFHCVLREHKKKYATLLDINVLIDDNTQTITEWEKAGGIGIFYDIKDPDMVWRIGDRLDELIGEHN